MPKVDIITFVYEVFRYIKIYAKGAFAHDIATATLMLLVLGIVIVIIKKYFIFLDG